MKFDQFLSDFLIYLRFVVDFVIKSKKIYNQNIFEIFWDFPTKKQKNKILDEYDFFFVNFIIFDLFLEFSNLFMVIFKLKAKNLKSKSF